jgi:transcriptional regulator with XRE-family HTH domain
MGYRIYPTLRLLRRYEVVLVLRQNRLREIRTARGLSGLDLQLLSGIPAQIIYRVERGLKRPLRYEKRLLAEALKVTVEELFPLEMEHSREIVES